MARTMKEVPSVRGVDIEEDTRDNDRLLLQQFFKERLEDVIYQLIQIQKPGVNRTDQAIIQWVREPLEVEPNVKGACRWHVNVEVHFLEAL